MAAAAKRWRSGVRSASCASHIAGPLMIVVLVGPVVRLLACVGPCSFSIGPPKTCPHRTHFNRPRPWKSHTAWPVPPQRLPSMLFGQSSSVMNASISPKGEFVNHECWRVALDSIAAEPRGTRGKRAGLRLPVVVYDPRKIRRDRGRGRTRDPDRERLPVKLDIVVRRHLIRQDD
jgi:hypothetical protein